MRAEDFAKAAMYRVIIVEGARTRLESAVRALADEAYREGRDDMDLRTSVPEAGKRLLTLLGQQPSIAWALGQIPAHNPKSPQALGTYLALQAWNDACIAAAFRAGIQAKESAAE